MNPTTPSVAAADAPDCQLPQPPGFAPDIRFRLPDRSRLADPRTLDQLLPQGHLARSLWLSVCAMDLSDLLRPYKARLHHPGSPLIDVRLLVTLWLFATHEGIDSARHLARLCRRDDVYRWICGGVSVSYHTLSDFRVNHADWLRQQFTRTVAGLWQDRLVCFDNTGQDGLRVRASAGNDSFKTAETLQEHLDQAQQHLRTLQAQDDAQAPLRGQKRRTKKEAARLRGAKDRCVRLRRAVARLKELAPLREARKKGDGAKTRVSETDPEAARMKMADGGFRPAYNMQMATDLDALVIVGAEATNAGNDAGLACAMQQQITEDYGVRLQAYYADGGYATAQDIEESADEGIVLYVPMKDESKQKEQGQDPYARKKRDSDAVAAWRQRMGTQQAKQEYKKRGKAEWSNAGARRSGLYQVRVRGLQKAGVVLLWYVLLVALLRGSKLRQKAGTAAGPEAVVQVAPAPEEAPEKAPEEVPAPSG
jgi:transposase